MAKINQTSVAAGTSGYRRGVIFGLTMAEVLLLILFCLLLAYQLTYDQLAETEEKMKETTLSEQDLIAKNQQLQDKIVQLDHRNNKLVDEIAKNTPTDNRLVQAIQTNLTALKVNSPDKYKELSEKIKNNPESLYTSTFVEVEWLQDATTLEQFVDKFIWTGVLFFWIVKRESNSIYSFALHIHYSCNFMCFIGSKREH